MRRKMIYTLLITFLITTMFSTSGISGNAEITSVINPKLNTLNETINNDCDTKPTQTQEQKLANDSIDQQQTENCEHAISMHNESWCYAQGFRPTLNILTRIQLFLVREGNPSDDINITVSIRKFLHKPIAIKSIKGSQITVDGNWVEFDFFYQNVIPNCEYYIVCNANGGTTNDHFSWCFGDDNPYENSDVHFSEDGGNHWELYNDPSEFTEIDLCFRTYGLENTQPDIPIKPDGPTEGQYGKPYTYTTQSIDSDNDVLYYLWSWGDGTTSEWLGEYDSGEECQATHIWQIKGSYLIKVKVKDEWGAESDWSDLLTIRMQKRKFVNIHLLDLLNQFESWNMFLEELFLLQ